MKTEKEINDLKTNWLCDPIWDIEKTEGFEEYKTELHIFRLEQELSWERQRIRKFKEAQKGLKDLLELF